MANEKAVYAPGELDKIKGRLGPLGEKEAKRMQKMLGGEVGRERTEYEDAKIADAIAAEKEAAGGKGKARKSGQRIIEVAGAGQDEERAAAPVRASLPVPRPKYAQRVRMDACCADAEFGIKTAFQSLVSKLSFFNAPQDKVSVRFVKYIILEYYKQIEIVVHATRLLYPRNNKDLEAALKKLSPFAALVLDTLRQWKLDALSREIARLQRNPRAVRVQDFSRLLKEFYRPLVLLEKLSAEEHIQGAFDKLHRALFMENPSAQTEALRSNIADALAALEYTRFHIHRFMYPLLMKILSEVYLPYEEFFSRNRAAFLAFLNVSEESVIAPALWQEDEQAALEAALDSSDPPLPPLAAPPEPAASAAAPAEPEPDAATTHADVAATRADAAATRAEGAEVRAAHTMKKRNDAEQRALDKGLDTLELLFPDAGWKRLDKNPDLYPYFADLLDLKKNSAIISPLDPSQSVLVLARIAGELLVGFRSMQFALNFGEEDGITPILDQWQRILEESFYGNYIPKIDEYARIFDPSKSRRPKTTYAMNLLNDIHWMRRYYFFPHYEYKSGIPPSFSKKNVTALYATVRDLRRMLTEIAEDIDAVKKNGGLESGAVYLKAKNAEAPYHFEIENPLSKRLGLLLPKKQRTNITLVYFTLAICAVLDERLNNPASAAYQADREVVYRSLNNEGREPVLWVEKRTDVAALMQKSIAECKGAS